MQQTYQAILRNLKDTQPPATLQQELFHQIESHITRRNRVHHVLGTLFLILSFVAFIPLVIYTGSEFQRSGFGTYFSLLFTDRGVILANMATFALSLVDSFPFFAITATSLSVFVFLLSMRYIFNGEKEFSYQTN